MKKKEDEKEDEETTTTSTKKNTDPQPPKRMKGYKTFVENLQKEKQEVEEVLHKHGLQTKKEDITSPIIEVESISKKDKFEIESERDAFFVKNMDKSQQPQQREPKKKQQLQQPGRKVVPISDYVKNVNVKPHKGINTPPEERYGDRKFNDRNYNNKERNYNNKERNYNNKQKNEDNTTESKKETSTNENEGETRQTQQKQQRRDSPQQNYRRDSPQQNYRRDSPQQHNRNKQGDLILKTRDFPPLSGPSTVEESEPAPWFPSQHN